MTTERARLVALPLAAALIVAVAVGTAAHQSSQSGPVDRQASIEATTVVLTLLGMTVVLAIAYMAFVLLTGERQLGGGKQRQPSLLRDLMVTLLAVALVAGVFALVMLWPAHGHPGPAGGVGPGRTKPPPISKPLPYDAAVGVLTAGSAALVVVAIVAWMGWKRHLGRRGRRGDAFLTQLPETAEQLTPDVLAELRSQLATLEIPDPRAEPDPRKAVIAAWTAMTEVIGRRWRLREASETPFEYLREALTGAGVRPGSAGRLTSLFEEARWGASAVGEGMRADAIAALDAVHDELQAQMLPPAEMPVAG